MSTTRRALLTGAAALPAAMVLPATAALPVASGDEDPVVTLYQRWRAAQQALTVPPLADLDDDAFAEALGPIRDLELQIAATAASSAAGIAAKLHVLFCNEYPGCDWLNFRLPEPKGDGFVPAYGEESNFARHFLAGLAGDMARHLPGVAA